MERYDDLLILSWKVYKPQSVVAHFHTKLRVSNTPHIPYNRLFQGRSWNLGLP